MNAVALTAFQKGGFVSEFKGSVRLQGFDNFSQSPNVWFLAQNSRRSFDTLPTKPSACAANRFMHSVMNPTTSRLFSLARWWLAVAFWAFLAGTPQSLVAQDCRRGLDAQTFKRVLHERFSALLNPSSNGVPGSYAALDIKDSEATFASTTVLESGLAITVKAHGGIADGILSAINDRSVNPKFGADVQLHFLGNARQAIQFDNASCEAYYSAIRKSEEEHAMRDVEIKANYQRTLQSSEVAGLNKKLATVKKVLDTATVPYIRDSLLLEASKAETLRAQAQARSLPTEIELELKSGNLRAADQIKARALLKVVGIAVGWWSFGYGAENASFRLFDPTVAFGSQVTKRAYLSHAVGLVYSHYSLTEFSDESRFWSIAGRLSWENNLSSLSKVELTDRDTFGAVPNERISEKKYTAYKGAYSQDRVTFRLLGDCYRFFFLDNQGALHLFPAVTVEDQMRPAYATGVGFLITARKEKDKETYLNAELFFNLNDLTDSQDSGARFWGRSELGLRFSFPISFSPGV